MKHSSGSSVVISETKLHAASCGTSMNKKSCKPGWHRNGIRLDRADKPRQFPHRCGTHWLQWVHRRVSSASAGRHRSADSLAPSHGCKSRYADPVLAAPGSSGPTDGENDRSVRSQHPPAVPAGAFLQHRHLSKAPGHTLPVTHGADYIAPCDLQYAVPANDTTPGYLVVPLFSPEQNASLD